MARRSARPDPFLPGAMLGDLAPAPLLASSRNGARAAREPTVACKRSLHPRRGKSAIFQRRQCGIAIALSESQIDGGQTPQGEGAMSQSVVAAESTWSVTKNRP